MFESKGVNTEEQHDQRVIVLLLIGFCICLPHLYSALKRTNGQLHQEQSQSQHRLVWLESATSPDNGLYWLENSLREWPAILAALGNHRPGFAPITMPPIPSGALPPLADTILPAYRLSAEALPQAISFPVRLAPIFFQPIPINQATIELLMTIPGVGRSLATSIIDYRTRVGGIRDRTALLNVEGVGEKKAAIIEEYIRF